MPAAAQSSANDKPAALAVASISAAVHRRAMDASIFAENHHVNSILATRRAPEGCALNQCVMDREREAVRNFLLEATRRLGTDLTGLARRAGLSPSTITRFVNSESKHIPTTRTLSKIAMASGLTPPLPHLNGGGDDQTESIIAAGHSRPIPRMREWIDVISRLPPAAEHNILEMLRGIADATSATQQQPSPRQFTGRRRNPKSAA